jgi:hypothetical protein
MQTFKRYDGKDLSIDSLWTTPNYTVTFLSESDGYILIQDVQGTVASIAKGVFISNHQHVPTDDFLLDPSLHRHYFKEASLHRKENLDFKLLRKLKSILEDSTIRKYILQTPHYYLIRPRWLRSSLAYGGGCQATLGAMIQAWASTKKLQHKNIKALWYIYLYKDYVTEEELANKSPLRIIQELNLMSINGSPLSGMHSAMAFCTQTNDIYLINNRHGCSSLPGGVLQNFKKLHEVAQRVDFQIQHELLAIEQLLRELE